jgi:hypothetical protein
MAFAWMDVKTFTLRVLAFAIMPALFVSVGAWLFYNS